MSFALVIGFVLVGVVAAHALVASLISLNRTRRLEVPIGRHNSAFLQLEARMKAVEKDLAKSSQAKLAAEVADLAGAVSTLADSQRRQFGKLWQALGTMRASADDEDQQQLPLPPAGETPEETRARLRLQHGLPRIGSAAKTAATEE